MKTFALPLLSAKLLVKLIVLCLRILPAKYALRLARLTARPLMKKTARLVLPVSLTLILGLSLIACTNDDPPREGYTDEYYNLEQMLLKINTAFEKLNSYSGIAMTTTGVSSGTAAGEIAIRGETLINFDYRGNPKEIFMLSSSRSDARIAAINNQATLARRSFYAAGGMVYHQEVLGRNVVSPPPALIPNFSGAPVTNETKSEFTARRRLNPFDFFMYVVTADTISGVITAPSTNADTGFIEFSLRLDPLSGAYYRRFEVMETGGFVSLMYLLLELSFVFDDAGRLISYTSVSRYEGRIPIPIFGNTTTMVTNVVNFEYFNEPVAIAWRGA